MTIHINHTIIILCLICRKHCALMALVTISTAWLQLEADMDYRVMITITMIIIIIMISTMDIMYTCHIGAFIHIRIHVDIIGLIGCNSDHSYNRKFTLIVDVPLSPFLRIMKMSPSVTIWYCSMHTSQSSLWETIRSVLFTASPLLLELLSYIEKTFINPEPRNYLYLSSKWKSHIKNSISTN